MSETDGNIFSIDPCPKCGGPGDYIGGGYGEWRVIACKCGYNAPGMAVVGTATQPDKQAELQAYADKATVDIRAKLQRAREGLRIIMMNTKPDSFIHEEARTAYLNMELPGGRPSADGEG
jgi:ssDNA-binding Zn-finger/Zn-ribbon topoisomerase 1